MRLENRVSTPFRATAWFNRYVWKRAIRTVVASRAYLGARLIELRASGLQAMLDNPLRARSADRFPRSLKDEFLFAPTSNLFASARDKSNSAPVPKRFATVAYRAARLRKPPCFPRGSPARRATMARHAEGDFRPRRWNFLIHARFLDVQNLRLS